jgi:AcrR family transcriptional regulator
MTEGVRAPRQQRARKTWESLLKAGAELLAEYGYDGFTLPEVGRRAGVSNGGMYWRVDSKQALLAAIHEQFLERVNAHVDAFYARADLEELELGDLIEAVVRHAAEIVDLDGRLLRALVLRGGSDPDVAARGAVGIRHHAESASALLAPRLRSAGHPDPEAAVAFTHSVIYSALINRVTWPDRYLAPEPTWDAFVTRLARLMRDGLMAELDAAQDR